MGSSQNIKQDRKERYVGVYLESNDRVRMASMAKRKTHETGLKHSISDIVRLAIKEYLKKEEAV